MFHTTHALKFDGFRNHLIALCHPFTQTNLGALMKVQERSNDIQFVNWIVLFNLMVDPIRKIGLNDFKAVLYQEIMTSILVFYFDKVIRVTSEDFENSPQLTWTTAIIHLWRFFCQFLKLECPIYCNYMEKSNKHIIQKFSFFVYFLFGVTWRPVNSNIFILGWTLRYTKDCEKGGEMRYTYERSLSLPDSWHIILKEKEKKSLSAQIIQ